MASNLAPIEQIGIAIMAKAPMPGLTKTRLISALGTEGAAELQRTMILRTVATALEAGIGSVSVWCGPDTQHRLFQDIASKHPVQLHEQSAGDLGDRMHAAFVAATAVSPTLLIGVDCPTMAPAHLRRCGECLCRGDDAVFLPAEDGGYVLVGLWRPQARLFKNIEWGGSTVMAVTRERLRQLNLIWSEPEKLWDLDRPDDLQRWKAISNNAT
ncbi:MAG: glycosyltransferase [Hyphomicrobiales bacterium]|nr:MAG: glycosyltransferase [Hyphomicrobiales bacterium]